MVFIYLSSIVPYAHHRPPYFPSFPVSPPPPAIAHPVGDASAETEEVHGGESLDVGRIRSGHWPAPGHRRLLPMLFRKGNVDVFSCCD